MVCTEWIVQGSSKDVIRAPDQYKRLSLGDRDIPRAARSDYILSGISLAARLEHRVIDGDVCAG